jgi:hypothetical protein
MYVNSILFCIIMSTNDYNKNKQEIPGSHGIREHIFKSFVRHRAHKSPHMSKSDHRHTSYGRSVFFWERVQVQAKTPNSKFFCVILTKKLCAQSVTDFCVITY